jgi:glycopeptidolipid biosynthesis protein
MASSMFAVSTKQPGETRASTLSTTIAVFRLGQRQGATQPMAGLRLCSHAAGERDLYSPSASVQMDPAVVGRVKKLTRNLRIRRYSVITAACALLVRGRSANGSEVTLDFPVSRRVRRETATLPEMLAGAVPLVLKTPPRSTVAEFCQHVDSRTRELLQHQRFPAHVLEGEGGLRSPRQAANRVAVNFIPSRPTLDLAGAPATATYTDHGPVGHFGLFFLGASDQLFSAQRALASRLRVSKSLMAERCGGCWWQ